MTTTNAPAPTKPGIKKLNIGALAAKPKAARTEYPALDDPAGDVARLAAVILDETEELDALEGSLGIHKAELRAVSIAQYFPLMHGKGEIPSSVAALTADGREVLVAFINKYKALPDETDITAILGEERTGRFFRQKLTFKVDCDKIPEAALGDMYEELTALFAKYGATAALSATQGIVPTADFHKLRHTQLSIEENCNLDLACPVQAQVKTKGRKKS